MEKLISQLQKFGEIAIIGATSSGKSDIAFRLAQKVDSYIFSIDSLAIYREIDIVSAKPSKSILEAVPHFGIDELSPDTHSNVTTFIDIYKKAEERAKRDGKYLIIVGGTSFYLKSLLVGISPLPKIDNGVIAKRDRILEDLKEAWEFLNKRDPQYCRNISPNDIYRITRGLDILLSTNTTPTEWFKHNPPKPILSKDIPIFNISIDRERLRKRIQKRTKQMIEMGAIDEVERVIGKYGRDIQPSKAIGIKEILDYLDGKITNIEELTELISIHTAQLAKRQTTFNRTQFRGFSKHNITLNIE